MRSCIVGVVMLALNLTVSPTPARAFMHERGDWPRVQTGYATWVTHARDGNESASGEIFRERKLVAAHRTLPWGSVVRVVNLENQRAVTVRVIDRGPYGENYREGAIIDLSKAAARRLDMIEDGKVRVRVVVLRLGAGSRSSPRST